MFAQRGGEEETKKDDRCTNSRIPDSMMGRYKSAFLRNWNARDRRIAKLRNEAWCVGQCEREHAYGSGACAARTPDAAGDHPRATGISLFLSLPPPLPRAFLAHLLLDSFSLILVAFVTLPLRKRKKSGPNVSPHFPAPKSHVLYFITINWKLPLRHGTKWKKKREPGHLSIRVILAGRWRAFDAGEGAILETATAKWHNKRRAV